MDREWISSGIKFTPPYEKGVKEFINFVREKGNREESILCPCSECPNLIRHDVKTVQAHLNYNGMSITYTRWIFHGEEFSDDESNGGGSEDVLVDSDDEDNFEHDNGNNYDDMATMVDDLEKAGKKGPNDPNIYAKLIEEAKRELHEGCTTMTRLNFIIKMLHIKSSNRVTNRTFDLFMQVLCAALPGVKFPKSYAEAKSVLSEVGLGYETIHVCKFDCCLYWGDHMDDTHCHVCGLSRWRDPNAIKKVAHKVLRYFPIKKRLQRLFVSKEMSTHTRWHKEKRVGEKGVLKIGRAHV